jgi:hypothetical protein
MQKKVDAPAPPNLRDAVLEAHEAARKAYEFVPGSFNTRIVASHKGIDRPIPARQRKWKTKSGRANFIAPPCLSEDPSRAGAAPATIPNAIRCFRCGIMPCAATYLPQNRSRSGFGGIRPPLRLRAPRPSTQRFGLPG